VLFAQAASIVSGLLIMAVAHSRPASAASSASVDRYWFAEVLCSMIRLRLVNKIALAIAARRITTTINEAAPRCGRRAGF
jgi:hypothetical protein